VYLYADVLSMLGLPAPVARCAEGSIRPPLPELESPAAWYVFPPVLIPMWSDGSSPSYIGYWKHWFLDREPSFVRMYVEGHSPVEEIARTPEQLFCAVAMTAISSVDGIDEDLRAFANAVGIDNLAELDRVSGQTGDDPKGFVEIAQFATNTPLESTTSLGAYTGTFPTGEFLASRPWWNNSCSFEMPEDGLSKWPDAISRPPWLDTGSDKGQLFEAYLRDGDLRSAWLTLNSTGWSLAGAKLALGALRDAAGDGAFSTLVAAWLSIADESAGGY